MVLGHSLITVRVSNEMATEILTTGFAIDGRIAQGLPKGCKLVAAFVGANEDLVLSFRAPAEFTRDITLTPVVEKVPTSVDPFGEAA
jgi:hypothetical protein